MIETVSKQARTLLKEMIKVKGDSNCVIYEDYSDLIERNPLATEELILLSFVEQYLTNDFRITSRGLIFLQQYKTFSRQLWLTSFWIPLAVSVFGTSITLLIQNWLFN
jgi:hypothetical protein|nr:MAG TPA: hypothetical protein [Caudoviricetes sp.]